MKVPIRFTLLPLLLVFAGSALAATGALPAFFKPQAGTPLLLDNSVVEIVYDGSAVWIATGNGISRTTDGGVTWMTFGAPDNFEDDAIGAIGVSGSRLLTATASSTLDQTGAGLYFTDNDGDSWTRVDNNLFSRVNRLAYDLAVFDSVIFAPVFGAGLLKSLDHGANWTSVFPNADIKEDFEIDSLIDSDDNQAGLMFSAVIDPYHDDTTIVWAGSAEGVHRFYHIGKHKKLISLSINDIADTGDDWWYATDHGITKFNDTTLVYLSWDADNGLPDYEFTAIAAKGDTVIAGAFDTEANSAAGFVVTTDGGATWSTKSTNQASGSSRRVEELAFRGDDVWAACSFGGLIKSTDLGDSWSNVYFNDADISEDNLLNRVNCLDINEREDFYRVTVGTDSGIVAFFFNLDGDLDSSLHLAIADNELWGQEVLGVATFKTETNEEYWATVKSYKLDFGTRPATLRYLDEFATWEHFLTGPPAIECYDIEIGPQYGDTVVWVATSEGIKRSGSFGSSFSTLSVFDLFTGRGMSDTLTYNAIEMGMFETHFGSADSGLAQLNLVLINNQVFTNSRIIQPNLDPDQIDFFGRSYIIVDVDSVWREGLISGNFVPAMGIQRAGDQTYVWAGTRPANEVGGHRAACYSSDRGATWVETISNVAIWNFESNGDTVFFAADEGLYMSTDFGENWTVLDIRDQSGGRSIADDVPVYAVRMVGNRLWVGTEDGLAHSEDLENWTIIRSFEDIPDNAGDDDRSYVSPSPYSPYLGIGNLKFHYKLKNDGKVTITIYDFANNVVKTVVDGADRIAATQYDDVDTWDGTNSNGEKVAAGVYFYRLESSSGEEYWGKFMVIP